MSNTFTNQTSTNSTNDEQFELTWNEILYDGGLNTWVPRLSFRWLTIVVCIVGILGKCLTRFRQMF